MGQLIFVITALVGAFLASANHLQLVRLASEYQWVGVGIVAVSLIGIGSIQAWIICAKKQSRDKPSAHSSPSAKGFTVTFDGTPMTFEEMVVKNRQGKLFPNSHQEFQRGGYRTVHERDKARISSLWKQDYKTSKFTLLPQLIPLKPRYSPDEMKLIQCLICPPIRGPRRFEQLLPDVVFPIVNQLASPLDESHLNFVCTLLRASLELSYQLDDSLRTYFGRYPEVASRLGRK